MPDFVAASDRVVAAFNAMDFETLRSLMAPDLTFTHHGRPFACDNRDDFIDLLKDFAATVMKERELKVPDRITASGNIVVREGWYVGTASGDVEGWSSAGQEVRHKTCTIYRFNDDGLLAEWTDYG